MKSILLVVLLSLIACSHVFYQPSKGQFYNPVQLGLKYEDVWTNSKDGTKLHGWFFKTDSKTPKGTIVQFHGNAENISTHFLSLIWLLKEGYNLYTFDYRGYGQSEGTPDQKGVNEDALAALHKGLELYEKHGKGHFIVYGQSLGGIISLRALADFERIKDVNLLVQDSTFSSYQDIAFEKLKSRWFLLPISPLAFLLISDQFASDKVFDKILVPTLVIVGRKDSVIPEKFGKKIFKGISSELKWLWKLPEGSHIDVFHHSGGKYRQEFLQLLEVLKRK